MKLTTRIKNFITDNFSEHTSYENNEKYKQVYRPNEPGTRTGYRAGYIPEHRYVMQQKIERPLAHDEHVHHKDGNEKNNKIKNLEIVTPSEHAKIHFNKVKRKVK